VEACAVRSACHARLGLAIRHIQDDLQCLVEKRRLAVAEMSFDSGLFEHQRLYRQPQTLDLTGALIAIEHAGLEFLDQFNALKLYVNNRFMPYKFEHILDPRSIILKKVETPEEFLENFPH